MSNKRLRAFTLIELIVVIAIMAILITFSFVYFDNLSQKGRDSQRISDITQIQNALALYHRDEGTYPNTLTFGGALMGSTSSSTYMLQLPQNPEPRDDSNCLDNEYTYTQNGSLGYYITFCLGGSTGSVTAGKHYATPQGITGFFLLQDGLKLWLEADAGVTESGGLVTDWDDQSGNGNNAIQGNPANQPTLIASQINGKPAVYFNGTSWLELPTGFLYNYPEVSIFIVARPNNLGANGCLLGPSDNALTGMEIQFYGDGWIRLNAAVKYSTGFFTADTFTLSDLTYDSTETNANNNGVPLGAQPGGAPLNYNGIYAIGMYASGYTVNTDIAEILIYNRVLTPAEILQVEQYLNTKYDLY